VARLDLPTVQPNVNWAERYVRPAIELPLAPMLSGLAVAPGDGAAVSASATGPWGGTLDFGGLTEGALVLLPVFEPGALLYIGPGRARQGQGLAAGAGIETSMDVELSLVLVPKDAWPHSSVMRPSTVVGEFEMGWPRVETADTLMAVASGATLDAALLAATLELHHWLDDDFGLNEVAVSTLMGQALEYEIARVANEGVDAVVVAKVSKAAIPVPVEPVGTFPPGVE
jgi:acetamidase/formamidase